MEFFMSLDADQVRDDLPKFGAGDTIRVMVRVKEGEKERLQRFQGTVIGVSGGGLRRSFTVRKVSDGVGVERIFPIHSPSIDSLEVLKHGHVRRAKINYLKALKGKRARIREKRVAKKKA